MRLLLSSLGPPAMYLRRYEWRVRGHGGIPHSIHPFTKPHLMVYKIIQAVRKKNL